jgi:hypothetical protein
MRLKVNVPQEDVPLGTKVYVLTELDDTFVEIEAAIEDERFVGGHRYVTLILPKSSLVYDQET